MEGDSLREGRIRRESGATVLAIKHGDEIVANPSPSFRFEKDHIVLLLGTPEQLIQAGRLFEPEENVTETAGTKGGPKNERPPS